MGMAARQSSDESPAIETGAPFTYVDEDKVDNRTAFGKALKDLGEKNIPFGRPVCVLDCDLASSVKSSDFAKAFPDHFFQGGVQEHNTATVAGALSTLGIVSFFADFGAFGMDETYNQQRLNDINKTNLKLVLTHLGLDVGQDGKTHQCIDYIGLARNLYNFKPIVPADPNQVDRAVRYITATKGNFMIGTGRSQWPVIRRENGRLFLCERLPLRLRRNGRDPGRARTGPSSPTAAWSTGRSRSGRPSTRSGRRLGVINMACVTEVDEAVMERVRKLPFVFTYEDHNPATGIGPAIATWLLDHGFQGEDGAFRRQGVRALGRDGGDSEGREA